jgi:hypothetical protein
MLFDQPIDDLAMRGQGAKWRPSMRASLQSRLAQFGKKMLAQGIGPIHGYRLLQLKVS